MRTRLLGTVTRSTSEAYTLHRDIITAISALADSATGDHLESAQLLRPIISALQGISRSNPGVQVQAFAQVAMTRIFGQSEEVRQAAAMQMDVTTPSEAVQRGHAHHNCCRRRVLRAADGTFINVTAAAYLLHLRRPPQFQKPPEVRGQSIGITIARRRRQRPRPRREWRWRQRRRQQRQQEQGRQEALSGTCPEACTTSAFTLFPISPSTHFITNNVPAP